MTGGILDEPPWNIFADVDLTGSLSSTDDSGLFWTCLYAQFAAGEVGADASRRIRIATGRETLADALWLVVLRLRQLDAELPATLAESIRRGPATAGAA